MSNKPFFSSLIAITAMSLLACSNSTSKPISPNENGGMEGNADSDTVIVEDDKKLEELFSYIVDNLKFSYETTIVSGTDIQNFTQTFTPLAWYVDENDSVDSFGYAMSPSDGYAMFKYYLNDDATEVYPSIFEYYGYDELEKVVSIYGPISLAHPYMLEDTMDSFSYSKVGPMSYMITDTETMSIFQYMTTVGTSITNYINSITITIIDEQSHIFDVAIDLGQYGEITSRYTPLETTKIDFVNEMLISGELKGVDYYDEVNDFFSLAAQNNYTLHGPFLEYTAVEGYTIYCTNDYFYLKYGEQYAGEYYDYGYAFIKKGTDVEVVTRDDETGEINGTSTYNLNYDACFQFKENDDGELYFEQFVGPIENDGIKYVEVDQLPTIGEIDILYIVEENGEKNVYIWQEQGDGSYDYSFYSSWYDTVGDFYINTSAATFYLSSAGLCDYAMKLFEKVDKANGESYIYYSTNSDVVSGLANGMFGWGFQVSTTWMSYITMANLEIVKTGGQITEGKIGLTVAHDSTEEMVYYTMSDFGTTSVAQVEEFLNQA